MDEEDMYGVSWHDLAWIPILNQNNIMEYFSRSQFYDRQCNNEVVKMQRSSPENMLVMTGVEYELVHAQPPILYMIRKQYRSSPKQVTPMAQYYIIDGRIYQAPDLSTLLSSRLLNTTFRLQSSLEKALKESRFNPSKGYSWKFEHKKSSQGSDQVEKKDQASWFQRHRVDLLLGELCKTYPMKVPMAPTTAPVKAAKQEISPVANRGEKRSAPDVESSASIKIQKL